MKRVIYAAIVALGCTVTASAQSGMAADKMSQDKMAKDGEKSVMVTGCVAESGGKYMLNNAMMMNAAGTGMASGAPMASGSAMGAGSMSYMLSGGTLKPHVGHKVEVTGMMKPMDNGAKGKDTTSKAGMAKDDMMKKEAMAMGGTLTVKNVKMLAATCS
jgi:hypothetical protein